MLSNMLAELKRLTKAFGYSCAGIKAAWAGEAAFRLEVRLSIILVPLALWLGPTNFDKALLVAAWLLVPLVELLNSAIEAVVDLACGQQIHPLAKKAKDVGSAAVTVAMFIASIIWIGVLV